MRLIIAPNTVAVVLPCLNEGATLFSLVSEIRSSLPKVFVVDDGSQDLTSSEAARAGAQVLRHSNSRGKGAALQTGFRAAFDQGFHWALALDGDGQHAPSDIPHFLRDAERTSAAMIIGNRMQNAAAMPPLRRLANRWMSRRLGAYCGQSLPDSQCGFRLVHLPSWNRFRFSAQHFEIESELIVRFLKAGLPIHFIPIQTRYGSETSKIRPIRDTIRWFRWWKAIRQELALAENTDASAPQFAPTPQDATA